MSLFSVAKNALANASAKVSSGLSTVEKNANDDAQSSAGMGNTIMSLWSQYGTWVIIAVVGVIAWKWILPMLGLRKKRRGNPRSLARARRAKARKAGRL